MNKPIFIFAGLFLCLTALPQEITHQAIVVNIEVPVRVFDGGRFIDNLTIDDSEVYEDGKPQEIVAVYLIKRTKIERKTEAAKEKIIRKVCRDFILIFEINDYLPKVDEALDYFFSKVLLPGDIVKVVTPLRSCSLESNALEISPRQEIKNDLAAILRNDIIKRGADRRSFTQHIEEIMKSQGIDPDLKATMCMDILRKLSALSYFDESRLVEMADILKRSEAQKNVFLFYQKEALPIPSFIGDDEVSELIQAAPFDPEKIRRALSDSSITAHFIFLTNTPRYQDDIAREKSLVDSNLRWQDNTAEIFSAFTDMAKTTGGLTESSANAAHAFQKAVEASENYYLLYYHPAGYKKDGRFKEIKVRAKSKDYTITHRAGYFAD